MGLGKVLWKAIDGREFRIDTDKLGINAVKELQEYIAELRKQHGYEQPGFGKCNDIITQATILDPKLTKKFEEFEGTINDDELPENLKNAVRERTIESWKKPDPKKID